MRVQGNQMKIYKSIMQLEQLAASQRRPTPASCLRIWTSRFAKENVRLLLLSSVVVSRFLRPG